MILTLSATVLLTDTITFVAILAYTVIIIAMIVAVLSENRNPLKALGWVTALLLFPVGGAILYLVFGRSMRNVKMISRRNRRRLLASTSRPRLMKMDKDLSPENRRRILLAYSLAEALLYPDNRVEVFNNGGAMFSSLLADIAGAERYINMQFYIIANDTLGRQVADALIDRARHGVKIRVIYDYVGSFGDKSIRLFNRMRAHGIEVHAFFRVELSEKLSRLNWRNHRKAVIIDGRVGYIGGINVAQRYIDGGASFKSWRDMAARIEGPIVTALQQNFAIDWKFMGYDLLTDDVSAALTADEVSGNEEASGRAGQIANVPAQIVSSGPTDRWGNAQMIFIKAISGARRRIFIQTPYFLPSDALLSSLECAALSGVDIRIMLPLKSDSTVLDYASRSFIEECLLAGIKVCLYKPGMLHGKLLLIDDDFVTLGSTNFDYRSFEHNFEENILLYSRAVNDYVASLFLADQRESQLLKLSEWNRRPRIHKVRESICRLLSPIL